MSSAFLSAVAALICYGLGDLIYKRAAAAGIDAQDLLMGQSWVFCPAVVGYGLLTGNLHWTWAALWGALAGLGLLVGLINFLLALKAAPVTVAAPVFRMNFVLTVVLAIVLLAEPLPWTVVAALLLAGLAVWLLLGGTPGPALAKAVPRAWVPQLVVATVAMGAVNLFHKLGLNAGATPETLLAAQAGVFITCINAIVYWRRRDLRLPLGTLKRSAMAAVVLAAAFVFMLDSLTHGRASVMVPIAQMGFIVTALVGIVGYGEQLTGRKVAGLAASILALAALAVS